MNGINFNIENVEQILNTCKHLKNKLKQDLNVQVAEHRMLVSEIKEIKNLPPIWDDELIGSYLNSVVAENLQVQQTQTTRKTVKISFENRHENETLKPSTDMESNKSIGFPNKSLSSSSIRILDTQQKRKEIKQDLNLADTHLVVDDDFEKRNQIQGKSKKIVKFLKKPHKSESFKLPFKPNTGLESRSCVSLSRSFFDETLEKPHEKSKSQKHFNKNNLKSTSSQRLPLQRFADSKSKNVKFLEDHPTLTLASDSEQTTLFPRRVLKQTDLTRHVEEDVNVADLQIQKPKMAPIAENTENPETWSSILKQNEPKLLPKKPRLKKSQTNINLEKTSKNINSKPDSEIKRSTNGYDVITSLPNKPLTVHQEKTERLTNQKKCQLQRFPVLYIRPECVVQNVTNINIYDKNQGNLESLQVQSPAKNVKYLECKHEYQEDVSDLKITGNDADVGMNLNQELPDVNLRKQNKFFKALESENFPQISSTNSGSSQLSSFELYSFSSSSSSLSLISNPNKTNPSKKKVFKGPQTKRTACVQTENANKYPISPKTSKVKTKNVVKNSANHLTEASSQTQDKNKHSPENFPPKLSTQSEVNQSVNDNNDLHYKMPSVQSIENSSEDDIIAKIFERIQKDFPNLLNLYGKRNTSETNNVSTSPYLKENKQEPEKEKINEKQGTHVQASTDEPDVKLLPNDFDSQKTDKEKDSDSLTTYGSTTFESSSECFSSKQKTSKKPLLNPKSITLQANDTPSDGQIKRAVKIFIDSLTDEKKSCSFQNRTNTKPKAFTKLNLLKSTSSDSTETSKSLEQRSKKTDNKKKKDRKILDWCEIDELSTFSESSTSLSDIDIESDVFKIMQSISLDANDTSSMSDGVVKSLGEI